MFSITFVSALARFSSHILSSFSSPFASSGFLGSAGRTRARLGARPHRLAASYAIASYPAAASNVAATILYASRS